MCRARGFKKNSSFREKGLMLSSRSVFPVKIQNMPANGVDYDYEIVWPPIEMI